MSKMSNFDKGYVTQYYLMCRVFIQVYMCKWHVIVVDEAHLLADAELKLFGSSANGFSSYKSDLDVCLSLPQLSIETVCYLLMYVA